MIEPIQLDLFDDQAADQPVLNGIYYERSSGKFVSFVCGHRHFEILPGRCLGDKEWKDKTMQERAI